MAKKRNAQYNRRVSIPARGLTLSENSNRETTEDTQNYNNPVDITVNLSIFESLKKMNRP
jgi:hypothetical protein